jgi:uncharacterized membrane protein YhaH (DUF805 family)
MGFRESVTVCIQDYWTFSGRARRPEYWWFALFVFAVSLLLSAIDAVIFGADTLMGFSGLFGLLTFLPQLAVSWRRMHDTGRPGWHVLLPYISAALFFGLAFVNPESTIYPSFSIGLYQLPLTLTHFGDSQGV